MHMEVLTIGKRDAFNSIMGYDLFLYWEGGGLCALLHLAFEFAAKVLAP